MKTLKVKNFVNEFMAKSDYANKRDTSHVEFLHDLSCRQPDRAVRYGYEDILASVEGDRMDRIHFSPANTGINKKLSYDILIEMVDNWMCIGRYLTSTDKVLQAYECAINSLGFTCGHDVWGIDSPLVLEHTGGDIDKVVKTNSIPGYFDEDRFSMNITSSRFASFRVRLHMVLSVLQTLRLFGYGDKAYNIVVAAFNKTLPSRGHTLSANLGTAMETNHTYLDTYRLEHLELTTKFMNLVHSKVYTSYVNIIERMDYLCTNECVGLAYALAKGMISIDPSVDSDLELVADYFLSGTDVINNIQALAVAVSTLSQDERDDLHRLGFLVNFGLV